MSIKNYKYAGFWERFGAVMVDSLLMAMIAWPILFLAYGTAAFDNSFDNTFLSVLLNWILPVIATVLFWVHKAATPGKMALNLKVLDEFTGEALTLKQSILRYIGYFLSIIPLGAGYLWMLWDSKKRTLHDKLAGSVVVKCPANENQPVTFP